jgi:F-type H+-transporting ATPase subunit alpha
VPVNKLLALEEGLHAHFANTQGELINKINATGGWDNEIEAAFKQGISEFKTTGSW